MDDICHRCVSRPVLSLSERQRMTADAIILERAIGVLERRFGDIGPVPGVRAYLFNMALGLRDLALRDEGGDRIE
jgi:hypothetical protein